MKTWTPFDIEQLMKGYLSGTSLKELAREINRTPTAVNKALTRFGIRRERSKGEKTLWNDFGNAAHHLTSNPMTAIKKFDRRFRKQQRALVNKWVPMEQVLNVLDEKNHQVYISEVHKDPRRSVYLVDGRKVRALQVVFMANRYRIEQDKAPFYVAEVTC
jgi:hypothetical protein